MLVELLFSLVLLSLCLFPFLKLHSTIQQKRLEDLHQLSFSLEAKQQFAWIKEHMHERKLFVTFSDLKKGVQGEIPHLTHDNRHYHCFYTLTSIKEIKSPPTQLVAVDITFEGAKKTYGPFRDYLIVQEEGSHET